MTSTSRWFSPSTPVSSTNKTDDHNIAEILLKVVLNTITLTSNPVSFACWVICLRHYRTLSYISSLLSGSLIFINTSHDISFAFIFTDAQGLKDKPKILAMQGKILESLRRYTASHYPDDPRRYSKILLRLPSLRTVSAKAAERFLSLSLDGSLQLNSLVLDMIS